MMQIVPLDRIALAALVANERDALTAEMSGGVFTSQAMADASRGLAYALLEGGFPVLGMGLTQHWHGLAEAWALITTDARPRHLVQAARHAAVFMRQRQRDPAFRRIEMFVRAGECWSESFARALGFAAEGFLPRRDPLGRDYRIFGRLAPEGGQ